MRREEGRTDNSQERLTKRRGERGNEGEAERWKGGGETER